MLFSLLGRCTRNVRSIADLVSGVILNAGGDDLHSAGVSKGRLALPKDGLKSLLGADAELRIRDSLLQTLGVEPSFTSFNRGSTYYKLRDLGHELVPKKSCSCSENVCFQTHVWHADRDTDPLSRSRQNARKKCPFVKLWDRIASVIAKGIASTFISANSACVELLGDRE